MEKVLSYNIYLNERIIREPQRFFGRGELFSRIYAIIAGGHGSVSLDGPPRIGKGSLLYCLRFEEFQQLYAAGYRERLCRCVFVFVDIRAYATRNWDDFFKALNKEIVTQCRGRVDLDQVPVGGSEGFSALVEEITVQGYFLVLAFDSFEKLKGNKQLGSQLPLFLRSEAENVSYVIASTSPLDEVFPQEPMSSPFWNIFSHHKIGGLTPGDARKMVVKPAEDAGIPFSDKEVDWILELAGGHPLFLNRICRLVFDLKITTPGREIDTEKTAEIAYEELRNLFKSLWESMDERRQEKFLYALYEGETETFYRSALFQRFIEAQVRRKISIDISDIRKALKLLSDPFRLGKSNLRFLKLVAHHLVNQTQPSQSEIGVAIRNVLFEAWKRLEGPGIRRDTDPNWEVYNILHYCYFKHHLRNDLVALRLSITPRTFFRRKENALNKLFFVLQDTEAKAQQ